MNSLRSLLRQAEERAGSLAAADLERLLTVDDPAELRLLFDAAYRVKLRCSGKSVYLRGLIEMGNGCAKDCLYCGIRRSNRHVVRYSLDFDAVVRMARWAYDHGYGSAVLQSGEIESDEHTEFIAAVLRAIRDFSSGGFGVTLCLGEQTPEVYRLWRESGADRYLLRIETSDPGLYAALHPATHLFERRVACLRSLRELGYQVGSGVMIGLPGQTPRQLAADILFFSDMDFDMIGMGPYLPHRDTPLGRGIELTDDFRGRQLSLGLKMIALTRLQLHDVNIASTTALQALSDTGREQGLTAGANVLMPNVTDREYRVNYQLYESKPCLDETSLQCRGCLARRIASVGEEIRWGDPGDPAHYRRRIGRETGSRAASPAGGRTVGA